MNDSSPSRVQESVCLRAADLEYHRNGRHILSEISASFEPLTFTALMGPNGSGKSSLLRMLAANEKLAVGSITVQGLQRHGLNVQGLDLHSYDLHKLPRRRRARTIAVVEQQVDADSSLRVGDAVMLGRLPHRSSFNAPSNTDIEAVERSLAMVDLADVDQRRLGELSGGERQKVHIARALAQDTPILLLDEPTNHLDISAQTSILALLSRLAKSGRTIIAALHDINLASAYSDNVVVLESGRIAASGPTGSTLTAPLISAVYGVDTIGLANPMNGRPVFVFGREEPS